MLPPHQQHREAPHSDYGALRLCLDDSELMVHAEVLEPIPDCTIELQLHLPLFPKNSFVRPCGPRISSQGAPLGVIRTHCLKFDLHFFTALPPAAGLLTVLLSDLPTLSGAKALRRSARISSSSFPGSQAQPCGGFAILPRKIARQS